MVASGTDGQTIDEVTTAKAFAKAVHDGDFVNFRFLFAPFSPTRPDSIEQFEMAKYDYLLPDAELEDSESFGEILGEVKEASMWSHIDGELRANRPAQMPSKLLLLLADNAIRLKKYGYAAQTYELLRIRKRMKETFFSAADSALEKGNMAEAVGGYMIAVGLSYDYAAFPEPLPQVPDFQTRALMLHAEYPKHPGDSVGMLESGAFLDAALGYLLNDGEAAGRLCELSAETRLLFLKEFVTQQDPEWGGFSDRYGEAVTMMDSFGGSFDENGGEVESSGLKKEIEAQQREDPRSISARLLGRTIEDGEWWQYMKELAYVHPASVLFVARQIVGDTEVVVPRVRGDSSVVGALKLLPAQMTQIEQTN